MLRCQILCAASLIALTFSGCAIFSGKPPLPKNASIEHVGRPVASTDFAAIVANADVIYFPDDRATPGVKSEPAALLLEALQQSGKPLAIAWDLIDASQQPLLDSLGASTGAARAQIVAQLDLAGSGRAREYCRGILRESNPAVRQIALRCPAILLAKLSSREALTPEEEKQVPRGFRVPRDGFASFAESNSGRASEHSLADSYRAQLLAQEFAAEKIVRHFRALGGENKLLVFLSEADLQPGRGVPAYVAQKVQLRQLVLGSDHRARAPQKLLTRSAGRRFEIVDRAPIPARD